jgi:O-acetyl-ADP-ribose deacetylase (regulator of RNase III)
MPFQIIEGDITEQSVDAIVNAANPQLQMGGGVCGAIFSAAGPRELQAECDLIGGVATGDAVITGGYALPASHIIHTAGPVWHGGGRGEEALLRSSYQKSLALAEANGLRSIAFPLISGGIYGYPRRAALDVAETAIRDYLDGSDADIDVRLVVRSREDVPPDGRCGTRIARYLFEPVETRADKSSVFGRASLLKDSSAGVDDFESYIEESSIAAFESQPAFEIQPALKEERWEKVAEFKPGESFAEMLRRYLIDRGIQKDSEIYKKANVSKDVWSKIVSIKDRVPSKRTAVAIAIALGLNTDQAKDLLLSAGYALSDAFLFDQIVTYSFENEIFDIYKINEILFKYEQPLLGSFSGD